MALDEVAQNFINRHPDAVGLDLGAGLDTRVFRIAPRRWLDGVPLCGRAGLVTTPSH
jgi:O-methyltransferase involved in polyketide biosynthesis